MTHHAIQSDVDDISSKLKFIARIEPEQKISIRKDNLSLVNKKLSTKLWRIWDGYWHKEGRKNSYDFLKETIDRAYNLLLRLRHSSSDYDITVYRNFIIELINVEPGLRNLMGTYHKDVDYVTNLATMIDNLKVKITELCDYKNFNQQILRQAAITEIQQIGGGSNTNGHGMGGGLMVVTSVSPPALMGNEIWGEEESGEEPERDGDGDRDEEAVPTTAALPEPRLNPNTSWAAVAAKEPEVSSTSPLASDFVTATAPAPAPSVSPLATTFLDLPPPLPEVPSPPSIPMPMEEGNKPRGKNHKGALPGNNLPPFRDSQVKNTYEVLYNLPDNNPFETLKSNYQYDLECGLQPPSRLIKRNKRQL